MRLTTLELFELDLKRSGEGRLWNWRLIATNGEPVAHGTGEKYGAFSSPRTAWLNFVRTARSLGSSLPLNPVPPTPKGLSVLGNLNTGVRIAVKRVERAIQ